VRTAKLPSPLIPMGPPEPRRFHLRRTASMLGGAGGPLIRPAPLSQLTEAPRHPLQAAQFGRPDRGPLLRPLPDDGQPA
jgi:hypothetical protein